MIEGIGTYGVAVPTVPNLPSKKHLVIHLLDQLILNREYLRAMQDAYFDTHEEYCLALCHGIARVLARNYFINAYAAGERHAPRPEFTTELRQMYEAICAELQLSKSILDTAGTLDIEVSLRIKGFHLYIDITTFPSVPNTRSFDSVRAIPQHHFPTSTTVTNHEIRRSR